MRGAYVHPVEKRVARCAAIPLRCAATSEIGMRTVVMLVSEHPVLSMLAMLLALCALAPILLGAVLIHERQVGIVVKKFGARSLPPGRLIALAG